MDWFILRSYFSIYRLSIYIYRYLSMPSSSSRSTWCSLRQTPALYQSRSLRQHVIPLPHPSRQASTPRGCPSSARTGSPSAPPGPTPGAVSPWASAAPAGAAARCAPTTHQATVPSPWHPPPWLLFCFLGCLRDGFVRRTKPHPCGQRSFLFSPIFIPTRPSKYKAIQVCTKPLSS